MIPVGYHEFMKKKRKSDSGFCIPCTAHRPGHYENWGFPGSRLRVPYSIMPCLGLYPPRKKGSKFQEFLCTGEPSRIGVSKAAGSDYGAEKSYENSEAAEWRACST